MCFPLRLPSRMASQDLRLHTSRKSHSINSNAFLSVRHALIVYVCCLFTGEGTHSPQSDYVPQSPTTAPLRSSDRSTFPTLARLPVSPTQDAQPRPAFPALPSQPSSFSGSGWNQTKLGKGRGKKCHSNLGSPYCCKLIWQYFGTVLFTEQMLTYLRSIFFNVLCQCPSVCGGVI